MIVGVVFGLVALSGVHWGVVVGVISGVFFLIFLVVEGDFASMTVVGVVVDVVIVLVVVVGGEIDTFECFFVEGAQVSHLFVEV